MDVLHPRSSSWTTRPVQTLHRSLIRTNNIWHHRVATFAHALPYTVRGQRRGEAEAHATASAISPPLVSETNQVFTRTFSWMLFILYFTGSIRGCYHLDLLPPSWRVASRLNKRAYRFVTPSRHRKAQFHPLHATFDIVYAC